MRRSGFVLWAILLPVLLVATYLWTALGRAEAQASRPKSAAGAGAARDRRELDRQCDFPGAPADRQRLVITVVDSLRDRTALDSAIMPWLAAHTAASTWGTMEPCLSQLSLLCFRTMFEGREPLLVTGFNNYTGMSVEAPSLIHRWGARGISVAAVADQAFIKLYQPSLLAHAVFEEKPPRLTRDEFGRERTFAWLSDPRFDVVISHVIDTDATAHRFGVGHPQYVAKFRETDDFLREISARLGPRDSFLVLGDHGHDAQGYHSTGIPSQTAYFAQGPLFPRGARRDLGMASLYFLAGAVTCEPTPAEYTGNLPFDALAWSSARREAHERATPPPVPVVKASATSSLGLDAGALAAGFLLLLGLLHAFDRARVRALLSTATLTLSLSALLAHPLGLAASALATAGAALRSKVSSSKTLALASLPLAWGLAFGLLSPWVLVTLQNHVNPRWTIGFWAVVVCWILLLTPLSRRALALPRSLAFGFTAFAFILFGLFIGPYYYGSLRLLMFGVAFLLGGFWVHTRRDAGVSSRRLLVWIAIAVLPTLPVLFPVLKEWQPRWVLLSFTERLGVGGTALTALLVTAAVSAVSPDRRRFLKPALAIAAVLGLGIVTDLPPPVLLGVTLLQLGYVGFSGAAHELGASHPTARLLQPIGQASYALVVYFMLLGSLRFANVDFRFALALTPMEEGEAAAAVAAVPFVALKYFLPIVLMLLAGPRLRLEAPALLLLKALALGAGMIGMELADSPGLELFRQLQAQELALSVLLYVVMALLFAAAYRVAAPSASASEVSGEPQLSPDSLA